MEETGQSGGCDICGDYRTRQTRLTAAIYTSSFQLKVQGAKFGLI